MEHWNKAIQLNASEPPSIQNTLRNHIAEKLVAHNRHQQAMTLLNETIQLEPNNANALKNLGTAFLQRKQLKPAIAYLTKASQLLPDDYGIHNNLALALSETGNDKKAIVHFRKATKLKPNTLSALHNLAWILATHNNENLRNASEAVELSERACELTDYQNPLSLDTLAAAYAEAGRFSEAVQMGEMALVLLKSSGPKEVIPEVLKRIELFKAGRPYHKSP